MTAQICWFPISSLAMIYMARFSITVKVAPSCFTFESGRDCAESFFYSVEEGTLHIDHES